MTSRIIAIAAFYLAGAILLTGTAGCAGKQRNMPEKHRYAIEVAVERKEPAGRQKAVVKVRRFGIWRRFEGAPLVYRTGDVVYETDFYNAFLVPPAAMITEETRRWLAGSGLFAGVLGTESLAGADYVLEADISKLYGDYRQKEQPLAVVQVEFHLIKESGSDSTVIFRSGYNASRKVEPRSAAALVRGFNEGLQEILTAFEEDLRRALPAGGVKF